MLLSHIGYVYTFFLSLRGRSRRQLLEPCTYKRLPLTVNNINVCLVFQENIENNVAQYVVISRT